MLQRIFVAVCLIAIAARIGWPQAGADRPEAVSLLGTKLYARTAASEPKTIDAWLALGKAQADLWRYNDAIATYTEAIRVAPSNALLYRHRGHRYISTRQFARAVEDLERAAALDASSYDIWYHLGLAYYLQRDFARAARAYESCLKVVDDPARGDASRRDDSLVAVADWLSMTYRRAGRDADAARLLERITPDLKVTENRSYFDRLLLYKGLKKEAELLDAEAKDDLQIATIGYGIGNWHLYNGRRERAFEIFRQIVAGRHWPAFGFIAAEVELSRAK